MNQQNNGGRPPAQLDAMLNTLGQRLGRSPDQLRAELSGGQLGGILNSMNSQQAAQLQSILNDPQKLEGILNSPQVKKMLGNLK